MEVVVRRKIIISHFTDDNVVAERVYMMMSMMLDCAQECVFCKFLEFN